LSALVAFGFFVVSFDNKEAVLVTEPDTTFLFRLQNWPFGPFVPAQQV
jgi:hypothetical protein